MTQATNKYIPKDIGLIDTKATDLILKRVSNWTEKSKGIGREWNDLQIRDYLISMIIPYRYTDHMISELTIEFRKRVE